ncbi:MAG: argininosuccinate lyase [Bradymonadaceae bacterium]|nr:argininosuccinate lyase [Lujinxingiaceae bacterium]
MAGLIWDKGNATVDERIMRFLAGEDVLLDQALFTYDIRASIAHVRGLSRIAVLTAEESATICHELTQLEQLFHSGAFVLDARFEDGHSAIEAHLVEQLGEVGKKVHTGRSRNDQVLVAQRLYLLDALDAIVELCVQAARIALERADLGRDIPMPGYTHLQRAVPSSVGLWFAAFAEAFIDDAHFASMTRSCLDSNPLGTAAGYGVNLALDREGVTAELGFARMQLNPIYTQNSRGKFELQALMALNQCLLDVRRLAWDLSLFTTGEFDFVTLPDQYTTGSSIMPNKRNPDVIELLRAATAPTHGAINELMSLLSLPSGYHRDLQATKGPVLRALTAGLDALALIPQLLAHLEFRPARLRAAITPDMYATDRAIELASEGVPFREAYRRTAAELDTLADRTPEASLNARTSPGATADLRLDLLEARLDQIRVGL